MRNVSYCVLNIESNTFRYLPPKIWYVFFVYCKKPLSGIYQLPYISILGATKDLPSPPLSLVVIFFYETFLEHQIKFFFLSGPSFTTIPPSLIVVGPLRKKLFCVFPF